MCVVSMVVEKTHEDWYRQYPPQKDYGFPLYPQLPPINKEKEELEFLRKVRKLIDAAKVVDEATGAKDCSTEGYKKDLKAMEDRLAALEKQLDAQRSLLDGFLKDKYSRSS